MNTFQAVNKPTVLLVSEPTGLALETVEQLLLNLCKVVVVSSDAPGWTKKIEHLYDRSSLVLTDSKNVTLLNENINYIIFLSDSLELAQSPYEHDELQYAKLAAEWSKKYTSNTLFIFPYTIYKELNTETLQFVEKFVEDNKDLAGLVFVGDLVGPRLTLHEERIVSRILKDMAEGKSIRLPRQDVDLFLGYVKDVAREIIKILFSFGGVGEKTAIISQSIKLSHFYDLLNKVGKKFYFTYMQENWNLKHFESLKNVNKLEIDLQEVLAELAQWYSPQLPHANVIVNPSEQEFVFPRIVPDKPFKKDYRSLMYPLSRLKSNYSKINKKAKIYLVVFLTLVLITPYVFLTAGAATIFAIKTISLKGNFETAKSINNISKNLFKISQIESEFLIKFPLAGKLYSNSKSLSEFGQSTNSLVDRGLQIVEKGEKISAFVLGDGVGNIQMLSQELALDLNALYRDLSFLESDLNTGSGIKGYVANKLYGEVLLGELRDNILGTSKIIDNLPDLLGVNERKTYLLLFQNNMELRPTGGFIGSFAQLTFDKGKLNDFAVYDVYDADGQLKGHIEPPPAISKYLGEANWYLRDSNWDPEFSVSAQRAEWFLEKEMDVSVNGVIGVDLEFAKKLVDVFDVIDVKDYSQKLTSENFYEITQAQAEKEFFPGSRQKSGFLTALSREMLNRTTNLKRDELGKAIYAVYKSLEGKHVQFYMHDQNVQSSFTSLGWDGGITEPICTQNCFNDYLAIVEANLGVNKANYYVSRQMVLNANLKDGRVEKSLGLHLKNSAPLTLGENEDYKVYIRVVAPLGSEFSNIEQIQGDVIKKLSPEIEDLRGKREAGVYLEISPQTETKVTFNWSTPYNLNFELAGYYNLDWHKQAGTLSDPIGVNINASGLRAISKEFTISNLNGSKSEPVLTEGGLSSYNTDLERDFRSRLSW